MAPSEASLCLLSLALSLSYSYVLPSLPQTSGSCMCHLLSERQKALDEGGWVSPEERAGDSPEDGRFAYISRFSAETLGGWGLVISLQNGACLLWDLAPGLSGVASSLHPSVAPGIL